MTTTCCQVSCVCVVIVFFATLEVYSSGPKQPSSRSQQPSPGAVFRELLPLASEWENIGTLLDMREEDLDVIQQNYFRRPRDCLREMIKTWLKVNPAPTWEGLVEALEFIDPRRAEMIRSKYIL